MREGKTKSGFDYAIDERIGKDWRLANMIAISESEDADASEKLKASSDMFHLILGKDGVKKLEEHVASKNDGFVPMDVMKNELLEIIKSLNETKN